MHEQAQEGASAVSAARRKRLAAGGFVLLCTALVAWVYSQQGYDLDPRTLQTRIESFGWLAPAVYIAAAALRPFHSPLGRSLRPRHFSCPA